MTDSPDVVAANQPQEDSDPQEPDPPDVVVADQPQEEPDATLHMQNLKSQRQLDNEYGDTFSVMHKKGREEHEDEAEKRGKLLSSMVKADAVRRLCRRAGISSYATSAPAGEGIVRHALEKITDIFLWNVTYTMSVFIKSDIVYGEIDILNVLQKSFKFLGIKIEENCTNDHLRCESFDEWKNSRTREPVPLFEQVAPRAHEEIRHERTHRNYCTYFQTKALFALWGFYMKRHLLGDFWADLENTYNLQFLNCLQLVLENTLVNLLEKARFAMRQFTMNKSVSKSRQTLYARDLQAIIEILAPDNKILRGSHQSLLSEKKVFSRTALLGKEDNDKLDRKALEENLRDIVTRKIKTKDKIRLVKDVKNDVIIKDIRDRLKNLKKETVVKNEDVTQLSEEVKVRSKRGVRTREQVDNYNVSYNQSNDLADFHMHDLNNRASVSPWAQISSDANPPSQHMLIGHLLDRYD